MRPRVQSLGLHHAPAIASSAISVVGSLRVVIVLRTGLVCNCTGSILPQFILLILCKDVAVKSHAAMGAAGAAMGAAGATCASTAARAYTIS